MFEIKTERVECALHAVYDYRRSLKANEAIGSGAYATVYSIPKTDKVIKVVSEEDTEYYSFIKRLSKQKHPNPLLPTIYNVVRFKEPRKFWKMVVIMERLQDLTDLMSEDAADELAGTVELMLRSAWENRKRKRSNKDFGVGVAMLYSDPKLHDYFKQAAVVIGDPDSYDIHSGNIMVRNKSQLVLTDPVS